MPCIGRLWTKEERQQLLDLVDAGWPWPGIAQLMDRTESAVRWQLARLRSTTKRAPSERLVAVVEEPPRFDYRYIEKPRKCLHCKEYFVSEWIGKRLCPKCNWWASNQA